MRFDLSLCCSTHLAALHADVVHQIADTFRICRIKLWIVDSLDQGQQRGGLIGDRSLCSSLVSGIVSVSKLCHNSGISLSVFMASKNPIFSPAINIRFILFEWLLSSPHASQKASQQSLPCICAKPLADSQSLVFAAVLSCLLWIVDTLNVEQPVRDVPQAPIESDEEYDGIRNKPVLKRSRKYSP